MDLGKQLFFKTRFGIYFGEKGFITFINSFF